MTDRNEKARWRKLPDVCTDLEHWGERRDYGLHYRRGVVTITDTDGTFVGQVFPDDGKAYLDDKHALFDRTADDLERMGFDVGTTEDLY